MYSGTVKLFYPKAYTVLLREGNVARLLLSSEKMEIPEVPFSDNGKGAILALSILLLGILCINIWGFVFWGVFRMLNNTGRFRSALAMVISSLLYVVFFVPVVLVDAAFII